MVGTIVHAWWSEAGGAALISVEYENSRSMAVLRGKARSILDRLDVDDLSEAVGCEVQVQPYTEMGFKTFKVVGI